MNAPPSTTRNCCDSEGRWQWINPRRYQGLRVDGHPADKLLVVARSDGKPGDQHGLSLVLLTAQLGVDVRRTILMDGRNSAVIQPIKSKSIEMTWWAPSMRAIHSGKGADRGAICISAEMLGGSLELLSAPGNTGSGNSLALK